MSTLISIVAILIGALAAFETINGEPWIAVVMWALSMLCAYCAHMEYMEEHK